MYRNLRAEMARSGITNEQLAKGIGVNPATMSAKLNTAGRMRLDEAQQLRDEFFPGMTIRQDQRPGRSIEQFLRVLQIERIRNRRTDREKILVGICPGVKKQLSR